jgi:hypothetical protein
MAYNEFSGKPHNALRVAEGVKTRVDVHIPAPPVDGSEDRLIYLNADVQWKITNRHDPNYFHQVANLRVNWMRVHDPDGDTAYHDYTISPIKSSFLITLVHWEHGKAHIGGYWEVEFDSPHATAVILSPSRYSKGRQVRLL